MRADIFVVGFLSIALYVSDGAADEVCTDDVIGGCSAATTIYNEVDDNPVVDYVDDMDSGGSSMDEDFQDATESQPDYSGEQPADDDVFN